MRVLLLGPHKRQPKNARRKSSGALLEKQCTYIYQPVDEGVEAGVAHSQPVRAQPDNIDELVPATQRALIVDRGEEKNNSRQ